MGIRFLDDDGERVWRGFPGVSGRGLHRVHPLASQEAMARTHEPESPLHLRRSDHTFGYQNAIELLTAEQVLSHATDGMLLNSVSVGNAHYDWGGDPTMKEIYHDRAMQILAVSSYHDTRTLEMTHFDTIPRYIKQHTVAREGHQDSLKTRMAMRRSPSKRHRATRDSFNRVGLLGRPSSSQERKSCMTRCAIQRP